MSRDCNDKHTSWLYKRPRFIDPSDITDNKWVDVATGAAMLLKRDVIEQYGLFDERFFMYFEDIDLCMRFSKKGHQFLFVPSVEMKHLQSVTANRDMNKKNENYQKSVHNYLMKQRGPIITQLAHILQIYGS